MIKQDEELQRAAGAMCLHRTGTIFSCKRLACLGEGVLEQHWPEYKVLQQSGQEQEAEEHLPFRDLRVRFSCLLRKALGLVKSRVLL